jgi:DNA-binding MarR family transcriptional regulator
MNIYSFQSYTEALLSSIEPKKQTESSWTLSQLAIECQMQPSYLTNVLKGRCDFNSDQLARVCDQLGLSPEDYDYLALLLELKRTNFDKRRKQLEAKIKELRQSHLRAEKNISTKTVEMTGEQQAAYYLDPHNQLIHIFLSGHTGPCTVDFLAQKFFLPKSQVTKILNTLEEIHYIKRNNNKIEVLIEGRHLPRESAMRLPHHILMRAKSLDQMQRLAPDQTYSFSATISTEPEVRTKLQAEFLKFLKAAEKLVKSHQSEKLYQINFDLFPWEID